MDETEIPQANQHRTPVSEKLDRLYAKSIRCPYCGTKIPKFVATCENCGISKAQIAEAIVKTSNDKKEAKEKAKADKPARIWSKVRPADIPFWKMALGCFFGFFGVHCFIAKRKIRGWIILSFVLTFFICAFIFHPAYEKISGEQVPAHFVRRMFENQGLPVPFDVMGLIGIALWIYDWVTVLIGKFKYPVIIRTELQDGKAK